MRLLTSCAFCTLMLLQQIPVCLSDDEPPRPAPFAVGETLGYQVHWSPPWYLFFIPSMEAGTAQLKIAEELQYGGNRAVRIMFEVNSSGALAKLFGLKVQDRFEFITDPNTFCTFSAYKQIREGRRKRDVDVTYFPELNQLHIFEVDRSKETKELKRDEFVTEIPGCVRDLFSALYFIRRREYKEGLVHRSVVGDNANIKEVETRVLKRQVVKTPLGEFDSWKFQTVSLLGGLFKGGGEFHFWLSADERNLPVMFEAKVKLGKVTGKLKHYQP